MKAAVEFMNAEQARMLWRYDAHTGLIYRLSDGGIVGGQNGLSKTYRTLRHGDITMKVHRLAWLLEHGHWPRYVVDHINGVKSDNRLANLRDVPHAQNQANQAYHRAGMTRKAWSEHQQELRAERYREQQKQTASVTKVAASVTKQERYSRARPSLREGIGVRNAVTEALPNDGRNETPPGISLRPCRNPAECRPKNDRNGTPTGIPLRSSVASATQCCHLDPCRLSPDGFCDA